MTQPRQPVVLPSAIFRRDSSEASAPAVAPASVAVAVSRAGPAPVHGQENLALTFAAFDAAARAGQPQSIRCSLGRMAAAPAVTIAAGPTIATQQVQPWAPPGQSSSPRGRGRESRRVRFNSPMNSCVDITPYSQVYGRHPRSFDFDCHGMVDAETPPVYFPQQLPGRMIQVRCTSAPPVSTTRMYLQGGLPGTPRGSMASLPATQVPAASSVTMPAASSVTIPAGTYVQGGAAPGPAPNTVASPGWRSPVMQDRTRSTLPMAAPRRSASVQLPVPQAASMAMSAPAPMAATAPAAVTAGAAQQLPKGLSATTSCVVGAATVTPRGCVQHQAGMPAGMSPKARRSIGGA